MAAQGSHPGFAAVKAKIGAKKKNPRLLRGGRRKALAGLRTSGAERRLERARGGGPKGRAEIAMEKKRGVNPAYGD